MRGTTLAVLPGANRSFCSQRATLLFCTLPSDPVIGRGEIRNAGPVRNRKLSPPESGCSQVIRESLFYQGIEAENSGTLTHSKRTVGLTPPDHGSIGLRETSETTVDKPVIAVAVRE